MFARHQILTWSCPVRSLLLLRESCLSAVPVHTSSGWQRTRHVKERRYENIRGKARSGDGPCLRSETVCCSSQLTFSNLNCDKYQLRENLFESLLSKAILLSRHHHHHPQASAKTKQASYPVRADRDCLISTTCLRHWRSWDFFQPSLSRTSKIQYNLPQSYMHHSLQFVRPFSLSAHTAGSLNYPHSRRQPPSLSFRHARELHQAAPRLADSWRDCLSPVNENRCRQSLGPNLNLYQLEKERKGGSRSQGKTQARWASVLVSVCSVEAEPAFLFTLRSSTLKGRHKGDVSFAGGKCDPSDGDVVATALREAQEELGIKVTAERVWGVLKPLRDATGMMVAPVLANLGPLEELTFKPNPGEVEEIFTLSLSHLCNPQNRGYTHFRTGNKYGYTLPVFRNGKHRVWGLTAVALDHTLKLIVPP